VFFEKNSVFLSIYVINLEVLIFETYFGIMVGFIDGFSTIGIFRTQLTQYVRIYRLFHESSSDFRAKLLKL